MAERSFLVICLINVILIYQVALKENVQHNIPSYLKDCYNKPTLRNRALRLPATIGTLISLIQKAERDGHTERYTRKVGGVLDARVMSYSILHRFRLDGIERIPDVTNFGDQYDSDRNLTGKWKGLIPYAPLGHQYNRYKILFGELIPGNAILFPNSTLKPHEKCALHFMLSSTVDLWERGDEGLTCRRAKIVKPIAMSRFSECPLEGGVMAVHTPYSSRADTISPGTVIAGIAAALQNQDVPVSKLLHVTNANGGSGMPDWDPVFNDMPKVPSVLNTWAATLAGDLSEVAIYQGPYKLKSMDKAREAIMADLVIGADGWWGGGPNVSSATANPYSIDSRVAKWYYLLRNKDLEMTDAEIRGGIDGLLLGSGVMRWSNTEKGRIRLSQILEMYYSEKGMAAYGEPELKWCNRLENFLQGSGAGGANPSENNMNVLLSQTMSFAQVLHENVHSVQFHDELLQEFVQLSVQEFQKYLTTDIDDQHCADGYYGDDQEFKGYPQVDLNVVTDGTWNEYNFTKLMAYLSEECDVSLFGSRMSIMHGRTAKWIAKDAISASQVIYNISKEFTKFQDKSISSGLDLSLVLTKLGQHFHEKEALNRLRYVIKGIRAQVVLILAHGSSLLVSDQSQIRKDMESFLSNNPDVHLFFVTLDNLGDSFSGLGGGQTIKAASDRAEVIVPAVLEKLRIVPKRIVVSNCDGRAVRGTDVRATGGSIGNGHLELEDYVSYGQPTTYRLHPSYFKESREATIEFVGSGYGEMSVCMTRFRPDEPRKASKSGDCRQLSSATAQFSLREPCPGGEPYAGDCFPIYFMLNVTKSYSRCTEDDCRFPDQVRFTVWQRNLRCSGAATLHVSTAVAYQVFAILLLTAIAECWL